MIQVPQAMETMRSQPRRGITVVASHLNGWLPLSDAYGIGCAELAELELM
jgi:hypothetical protein